ncbi:unnamed protein product, partial [Mesorhabditis belari]|uniref:Protein kinase domain-containing protein n=1 Tax=Mesorhabditis belari TaxID=2138241 RepID=A0AAF3EXM8_9BILA
MTTITAQIPLEYSPDQKDSAHRKERIPPTAFHKIGAGSQAIVVAGVFRKEGERGNDDEGKERKVAMKRYDIVSLATRTQSTFTQLLREIQNTQYLIHPNIVTMMDSFYEEGLNRSLRFVWITTERMDHTLDVYFECLQRGNTLRDHRQVSALFVQMFRALDFLHQRGIMHRDVTPKNIGMKKKGFVIKLLDFGVCGQINAQMDHTQIVLTPLIYQPLEVILQRRYDCGVDIWAMGLVGMEMLGCKLMMPPLVNGRLTQPIKQQILDVIGLPKTMYEDIFQKCLSLERPRPRKLEAEIDTALGRMESDRQSSLTKANLKDLLLKLLDVNPQTRPRAYECLEHPYLLIMNENQANFRNNFPEDRHFRDPRIQANDFHVIGSGKQAVVIAAKLQRKGLAERVAAKRYDISKMERENGLVGFTYLLREIQATQYLLHPNIVEMKDSFYQNFKTGAAQFVWLVTERMDCSLQYYFDLLRRPENNGMIKPRDHRHLASLLVQLFRALDFLHCRGIMHRDLKPANVGMNRKSFEIKLLDFGVSGQTNSQGAHTKIVSTPPIYQPLEVVLQKGYDCGVDVWAVGLIALEMLGCKLMKPALANMDRQDAVRHRILEVMGVPDHKYAQIFGDSLQNEDQRSSKLNDELEKALNQLEKDREFLSRANLKSLLEHILTVNPQLRPKPSACLEHLYLRVMNQKLAPIPFDEAFMPNEYTPDIDDESFRKKEIPSEAFHAIGKGKQAIVLAGVFKRENITTRVAAKRYDIRQLEQKKDGGDFTFTAGFTFLLREISHTLFLSLTHPNVVKMIECFYQNWPNGEPRYVWLTTERMDCSLDHYFDRLSKPSKDGKDLTPKNIGLNQKNFEIKLLDFGVSGQINSRNGDVTTFVSTPPTYQPLEVILGVGYDTGVDVWAVGLVGVHMLGKRLTYPHGKEDKLDSVKQRILDVFGLPEDKYRDVFKGDGLDKDEPRPSTLDSELDQVFTRLEPDRHGLSKENLKALLKAIFTINRQHRPSATECLKMAYLQLMNQKLPAALETNNLTEKNERDRKILKNMLVKFARKTEE